MAAATSVRIRVTAFSSVAPGGCRLFTSPGNLHDCNPTECSSQRPHPWSEQKETEGGGFSFCAAGIQGAQQGASCAVIGGTPSFFVTQDGQEKDPIKSVSDKRLLLPRLVLPVSSGLLGISAPRTFSVLGHCSLPSHRTDLSSALRFTPSRILIACRQPLTRQMGSIRTGPLEELNKHRLQMMKNGDYSTLCSDNQLAETANM